MPRRTTQASTTRSRAVKIAVALLGLFVMFIVVAATVGSTEAVCRVCHSGQVKTLASSAHSGVSCYDCHLEEGGWSIAQQKTDEIAGMYPLGLIGVGLRSPARLTSRSACLACHSDIDERVSESSGLRIKHGICATRESCDGCHSTVAHATSVRWRSRPVMAECTACHKSRGATVECSTCHAGDQDALKKQRPRDVAHGPRWQSTHGMGDVASCDTCHGDSYCERCHGVPVPHPADFGGNHGTFAVKDDGSCRRCHQSRAFCDACHGVEMPHPAGYLRSHTTSAKGPDDPACARCHVQDDCDRCHSNHIHPGGSAGGPVPRLHSTGK